MSKFVAGLLCGVGVGAAAVIGAAVLMGARILVQSAEEEEVGDHH